MKPNNGLIEINDSYIDWSLETEIILDEEGNERDGSTFVQINNLFVSPEARGNGLARKLMDSAIKIIKDTHEGLEIKIVAEPKEKSVDLSRLCAFYESFDVTVLAF